MRYLLDTNFISELRKRNRSNPGVLAWSQATHPAQCALSVITIGEIREGIEALRSRDVPQALSIENWLLQQITDFADNILPITVRIADRWGCLMSATELPDWDLVLAATALEHDLTVVTRNVSHFEGSGVRLLNPWK